MAEEQLISTGVIEAFKLIASGGFGGAIVGIIGKLVVDRKLQNQKAVYDKQLESLKSKLLLETQKKVIEYTSLHDKQAQIIADFYAQLSRLYGSIERLMGESWIRQRKDKIKKEHPDIQPYIPSSEQIGLTNKEIQVIDKVESCNKELFEFYSKNKIYFSLAVCELTDRFYKLASYLAFIYQDVTLKDEDGRSYVNPKAKEVWDMSIKTIPKLLTQLEKEFRDILGVKA